MSEVPNAWLLMLLIVTSQTFYAMVTRTVKDLLNSEEVHGLYWVVMTFLVVIFGVGAYLFFAEVLLRLNMLKG